MKRLEFMGVDLLNRGVAAGLVAGLCLAGDLLFLAFVMQHIADNPLPVTRQLRFLVLATPVRLVVNWLFWPAGIHDFHGGSSRARDYAFMIVAVLVNLPHSEVLMALLKEN